MWEERFATITPNAIPSVPQYADIDPPPGAGDSDDVSFANSERVRFINLSSLLLVIKYSIILPGTKGDNSSNQVSLLQY